MSDKEKAVLLTGEERRLLAIQIGARINFFEDLMYQAADKKDTNRMLELSTMIKDLKTIQEKLY